jgi:hypothetical protein
MLLSKNRKRLPVFLDCRAVVGKYFLLLDFDGKISPKSATEAGGAYRMLKNVDHPGDPVTAGRNRNRCLMGSTPSRTPCLVVPVRGFFARGHTAQAEGFAGNASELVFFRPLFERRVRMRP